MGTTENPQMLFDLNSLIPQKQIMEDLTAPFTMKEIDDIIRKMSSDKAPGPDGFNDWGGACPVGDMAPCRCESR
jgi:hypothetical protein